MQFVSRLSKYSDEVIKVVLREKTTGEAARLSGYNSRLRGRIFVNWLKKRDLYQKLREKGRI